MPFPPRRPARPSTVAATKPEADPVDWIALTLLPGFGPISIAQAIERYGDPAQIAYRLPPEAFLALRGFRRGGLDKLGAARKTLARRAEKIVRLCERKRIAVVTADDETYPAALRELADPPPVLYQRGSLPEGVLRIAVVGSRTPTAYGRRTALGLAAGLAARGIEVVSGGAAGIDRHAHEGALEEGGRTVTVLGSGLLKPYPPEHEALFERIADNGALLSELAPLEEPRPAHFPRRNRLVSGLAAAVVVVEAAEKSGSLITAGLAADQGREVLAVPGPVSSSRSAGCNRLIQDGAKLVQNIDDILDELPPVFRAASAEPASLEPAPDLAGLSPDERSVLGILDPIEPTHLEEVAEKAAFGVARLQAALFGLELRRAVERIPGRYYVSRPLGDDQWPERSS
jgi:DNA processing protein